MWEFITSLWNTFWVYLDAMPETLKGALLGSFVTLVGVWATNRANQNNLRAQLAHDQQARSKEHALGLRKQIYLDVAEALAEGLRSVIALNDLDKTSIELIKPYASKAASMARIHVIAEEQTALLFSDFVSKIDQCFVDLRLARLEIETIHADMRYRQQQRDEHGRSRNRMFEIFTQERLAGPMPDQRIELLKEVFERERQLEEKYERERAELAGKLLPLHHRFTHLCFEERDKVVQTALPLIAAVRRELDLPIDEVKYAQVLRPRANYVDNLARLFGQKSAKGDGTSDPSVPQSKA